jgi:Na+-transporting methylmalonyl-CoA/oxaloacetate decarboxylase gamma subunit
MPNSLFSRSPTGMRMAVAGVLVLLLLPTVVAGVSGLTAESGESDIPSRETAQDVTLVSSQHGSVVAVHTPSREVI